MLEKLVIKGFQKHRSLTIEFDSQITTLWGCSDKGKSAVIRALRWVALNQRPNNHINWDAKSASVTLYVDGHRVTRKQGKGNIYLLDGKSLFAFSKDVPDQIKSLINLTAINFQRQHDAHFWISLPPGQVSKELNQIVDLSIIDKSQSFILSKLRSIQSKINVSQERLEQAKETKQKLRWAVEANKELLELEAKQQEIQQEEQRATGLGVLVAKVQNYQSIRTNLEESVTKGEELLLLAQHLLVKQKSVSNLIDLLSKAKQSAKLQNLHIPNIEEADRLVSRIESLQTLIETIKETEEELWQVHKQLQSSSTLLEKSRGKLCPVCGQVMK